MDKRVISIGMVLGSTVGGYIPSLFGVDMFSAWSIVGTLVGGILGIWLAVRLYS